MRAKISLDHLSTADSGEDTAEPHLWVAFFKVDGSTFGTVLSRRLENGRTPAGELTRRGIDPATVRPADSETNSSFFIPSDEAGQVPPLGARTGVDSSWFLHDHKGTSPAVGVDLSLDWETQLDSCGILHEEDLAIGCAVVLLEKDGFGDLTDAEMWRAFGTFVRAQTFQAVARVLNHQAGGSGLLRFPITVAPEHERRGTSFEGHEAFDAPGAERALGDHYRSELRPAATDFIGSLVFAGSRAGFGYGEHRFKTIWSPKTGSEEGTWTLDFTVDLRP